MLLDFSGYGAKFVGLRSYYTFRGFLDWKGHAGDLKELADLHLGTADMYAIQSDALFVISTGHPQLRKEVFENSKTRGATFMNLVHPWTDICASAVLGEGNVFQRGCVVIAMQRLAMAITSMVLPIFRMIRKLETSIFLRLIRWC